MTGSQTMRAGNATSLTASSRCAAPPLRPGPSGDTARAAANGLATTGRVLPVVTDRPFHTTTAVGLSNEPGPPHKSRRSSRRPFRQSTTERTFSTEPIASAVGPERAER